MTSIDRLVRKGRKERWLDTREIKLVESSFEFFFCVPRDKRVWKRKKKKVFCWDSRRTILLKAYARLETNQSVEISYQFFQNTFIVCPSHLTNSYIGIAFFKLGDRTTSVSEIKKTKKIPLQRNARTCCCFKNNVLLEKRLDMESFRLGYMCKLFRMCVERVLLMNVCFSNVTRSNVITSWS